jgi:predicted TIM-barrel fold metal-dependent hydrolase
MRAIALCSRCGVPFSRDLRPELKAAGVHCTVTIEAADGPAENEALLANARAHDWIAGVVGWVPLAHPADVENALEARAAEAAFVGVRDLINVEPDPDSGVGAQPWDEDRSDQYQGRLSGGFALRLWH